MAQQGYWMVCEDLYAGFAGGAKANRSHEPHMCMGYIVGFDHTEAMGASRLEVLSTVRRKLKNNIRFLLDCYADIPPPADSDNPPQGDNAQNTTYIFLGLKEIDINPALLIPLAA